MIFSGLPGTGKTTIARALAAQGAKVAIFDLNAEKGSGLAAEIGGHFCAVDITSTTSVEEGFAEEYDDEIEDRFINPDDEDSTESGEIEPEEETRDRTNPPPPHQHYGGYWYN